MGDTEYPPTERMWEELEVEVNQIKRGEAVASLTDREALSTDPAQQAITNWKQRNTRVRRS